MNLGFLLVLLSLFLLGRGFIYFYCGIIDMQHLFHVYDMIEYLCVL